MYISASLNQQTQTALVVFKDSFVGGCKVILKESECSSVIIKNDKIMCVGCSRACVRACVCVQGRETYPIFGVHINANVNQQTQTALVAKLGSFVGGCAVILKDRECASVSKYVRV